MGLVRSRTTTGLPLAQVLIVDSRMQHACVCVSVLTIHLCSVFFFTSIYQVRCHLRTSPKIAVKVEGTLYRHQNPAGGGGGGGSCRIKTTSSSTGASSGPTILHPACVVNGSLISQTFQILYRNEDVPLSDMAQFRLHVLVDSHKVRSTWEDDAY